jgi:lysophospholipase L1-like esterase
MAMASHTYTYLALGDSYTVGEGVPIYETFPYQAVQLLRNAGQICSAPEIVAKTGWTTDELSAGISATKFLPRYDFVTLLIGVNNQYRGRSIDEYEAQFEELLKTAIQFAGEDATHVIVLSIPDWGATPFATNADRGKIAGEIDAYNLVNKRVAAKYGAHYIDITPGTREANEEMLAADKLHPSGKEYRRWAMGIMEIFDKALRK